ncbi:hypothetical protein VTL71DRAFT_12695 [Oculimacula yallundae]|uniref:Uncharacterized protein n=1 Tax=Oculimacula yallundae TaxID=86028 RepID=A0ABR4CNE5_9HELO
MSALSGIPDSQPGSLLSRDEADRVFSQLPIRKSPLAVNNPDQALLAGEVAFMGLQIMKTHRVNECVPERQLLEGVNALLRNALAKRESNESDSDTLQHVLGRILGLRNEANQLFSGKKSFNARICNVTRPFGNPLSFLDPNEVSQFVKGQASLASRALQSIRSDQDPHLIIQENQETEVTARPVSPLPPLRLQDLARKSPREALSTQLQKHTVDGATSGLSSMKILDTSSQSFSAPNKNASTSGNASRSGRVPPRRPMFLSSPPRKKARSSTPADFSPSDDEDSGSDSFEALMQEMLQESKEIYLAAIAKANKPLPVRTVKDGDIGDSNVGRWHYVPPAVGKQAHLRKLLQALVLTSAKDDFKDTQALECRSMITSSGEE